MYEHVLYYRNETKLKRCKYMCIYPVIRGGFKVKQCEEETNNYFCGEHASFYYLSERNCTNVIAIEYYDEGDLVSFYHSKYHEYIVKINYDKRWLGMSNTIKDYKFINLLNFTYYKYKQCIHKWITMYLVLKYYIGDVVMDIWVHVAYHYIDR